MANVQCYRPDNEAATRSLRAPVRCHEFSLPNSTTAPLRSSPWYIHGELLTSMYQVIHPFGETNVSSCLIGRPPSGRIGESHEELHRQHLGTVSLIPHIVRVAALARSVATAQRACLSVATLPAIPAGSSQLAYQSLRACTSLLKTNYGKSLRIQLLFPRRLRTNSPCWPTLAIKMVSFPKEVAKCPCHVPYRLSVPIAETFSKSLTDA